MSHPPDSPVLPDTDLEALLTRPERLTLVLCGDQATEARALRARLELQGLDVGLRVVHTEAIRNRGGTVLVREGMQDSVRMLLVRSGLGEYAVQPRPFDPQDDDAYIWLLLRQ